MLPIKSIAGIWIVFPSAPVEFHCLAMYNGSQPAAMLPITHNQRQKQQQHLSVALAYYSILRNSGVVNGLNVGVRGGRIVLSSGPTPLIKITSRAIHVLSNDPAAAQLAERLCIEIACAVCGPGATLHFCGSARDRRMYRRAGFTVINGNISARLGRFVLGLS
jgi:hypothetical protein